jgi:hypothetical protein
MSRVLLLHKSLSERQIKKRIFKLMRPLIQAPDITDSIKQHTSKNEDTVLDLEYKSIFESKDNPQFFDENGDTKLYKLQIMNNSEI